jgi:peroxiredoxin
MDGLLERTDPAIAAVLRKASAEGLSGPGPINALRVGDLAPAFALPDQRGGTVALRDLLARGPVVLTFFRGGWCPFCAISLRALDAISGEIRRQGAELVGISPQRAELSAATAERNALRFPLLVDRGNEVARQYGLHWELGPEMRSVYERLGHPLPEVNAGSEWALPIPAGFVIDQTGRIVYAHTDGRVTHRMEPGDALREVSRLRSREPDSAQPAPRLPHGEQVG